MIRLTDLAGNGSFTMGGKKFEYGKVYSNPYATAFKPVNEGEESEDHEVSMAQNQLDSIIKSATELKKKMGMEEKQIPAWIQDHITNSENYISQAASNYHEYGDSNEQKVNEAGPCWKGYKQVGMKTKNGREVPNCVPEGKINEGRGAATIQKDLSKVVDAIQSELQKYKLNKGTDKAKQNVENLKKLNVQKVKLENELDSYVQNLYVDYELDQIHFMGRKK
jgi:hypothetical protein